LSAEERARAPAIHTALQAAVRRIDSGDRDFAAIGRAGWQALEQVGMRPDYFEVRAGNDLGMPESATQELVVLTAAHLGRARLIDNLQVRSP
ncbi:MAG TPA: pantoate--beta-alanine ligase, partial [Steroidobacteraceae bacterium]